MKKSFTIAHNKDGTCSSRCDFCELLSCVLRCELDRNTPGPKCPGPGVYRMRLDRIKGKK